MSEINTLPALALRQAQGEALMLSLSKHAGRGAGPLELGRGAAR